MLSAAEISPWRAWCRKIAVLTTVAHRRMTSAFTDEEFASRVKALTDRSLSASSLHQMIVRLWQIEGLAFRQYSQAEHVTSLKGCLTREAGPPAHCGLGMAAVLLSEFDPVEISRFIDAAADPAFVRFSYESIGAAMAAYEPDLFGRCTSALNRMGILWKSPVSFPSNPVEFLEKIPAERRVLVAHGFGRVLYFKSHGLSSAVRKAGQKAYLSERACIRGVVGAYSLINSADLGRVLWIAEAELDPRAQSAVRGGLQNTLLLLEWTFPGCLQEVVPRAAGYRDMLKTVVEEAARARRCGAGPPLTA